MNEPIFSMHPINSVIPDESMNLPEPHSQTENTSTSAEQIEKLKIIDDKYINVS